MQNDKRGAFSIHPLGSWGNQQLTKDCGIIPYLLYKNHGFRSVMVGAVNEHETFPYLEKYVRGLEMDFLPEDSLKGRIEYINAHAAEMDLFILYGPYQEYFPCIEYYKRVRPDGKIYLATDMNSGWASNFPHNNSDYKKFIQSCDVVAASCRAVQKYLSAKWGVPIELIRNGWYNFSQISFNNLFAQKENIILTVGRLGTDQKRNQDLLEAFAKVADDLPDWSIRLVGEVHETFNPWIENYFSRYPDLRERVTFTGLIEDKAALAEEYKRAKIFCLTSTFEGGTPNVTAEALFAGDFMIFSSIDAAYEATDDNKCGRVFPIGNVDALANIFRKVCLDNDLILVGGKNAVEYARRNFDAEHIVARLYYLLYGGETQ
ncbi:MAG: glycosyltransferase family 4 protein [Selenomonadaceae bacterium]|nr:glycosyltransferase family 4 protein [Selenomonadaceae bacterium]